jgi:energy-coupling factor transport system ATP-binding protein
MDLDRAARRFVAIASVLSMKPRILLLDEPQMGLDFRATQQLEGILAEEKAAGVTVVFVSHDMDFVARNADRVLILGEGRLLGAGSPASVLSDAALIHDAGLEIPAALAISMALGLPAALTSRELVAAWIARLQTKQ